MHAYRLIHVPYDSEVGPPRLMIHNNPPWRRLIWLPGLYDTYRRGIWAWSIITSGYIPFVYIAVRSLDVVPYIRRSLAGKLPLLILITIITAPCVWYQWPTRVCIIWTFSSNKRINTCTWWMRHYYSPNSSLMLDQLTCTLCYHFEWLQKKLTYFGAKDLLNLCLT